MSSALHPSAPAAAVSRALLRAFYRRGEVAAEYNGRRFGGAGGRYVNQRELSLVAELLPAGAPVGIDVGTGTGRVLPLLRARSALAVGLDTSLPMLKQAADAGDGARLVPADAGNGARLVQADAFCLPLRGGVCDAAVTLRTLFHFEDVRPVLRELRRAVKPGGILVCDTATWSPRSRLPLDRRHWGEQVSTLSRARFRLLAGAAGWEVLAERPAFLVSPHVYRWLPLPLARALGWLERRLPARCLSRVFWKLRAAGDAAVG